MEGEQRWNSFTFGVAIPPPSELNCFLNPNCDTSMDRNDPFQSALSSLVSSPAASNAGAGDGFVFRELIGKLGSICNSGENSPQSRKIDSTNNSCYTTPPLNSPPKLNLSSLMETRTRGNFGASVGDNQVASLPGFSPLNADPGFVERAAKFSCFGSRNLDGLSAAQFGSEMGYGSLPKLESGNLSRVSSNSCIKLAGAQETLNSEKTGDMGDSREGSSVSEQNPGGELGVKARNNTNSRKRKAIPKSKGHVKEEKVGRENDESSCAKRSKPDEDAKKEKANNNEEQSGNVKDSTKDGDQKQNKEAAKPQEPLKDYIHVRARRGQATDSHSLAERVRREKISERMKFLQDLVPGCNKVTGKAVVLDEIINYVQSLQRQVEFLSMRLATVNPRMDVNMEALLSKDMLQLPSTMFPDSSASAFPYGLQPQQFPTPLNGLHSGNPAPFSINPMDTATRQNTGIQMHSTALYGDSAPQIPSFWEDDLHSLVQMGFPQNQMQNFQGTIPATRMKTEL